MRWSRMLMAIAWPAFLAACLLEIAVFALVDPLELSWGGGPLGWSRQSVYTAAFFAFWMAGMLASTTALWLLRAATPEPGWHHD